MSQANSVIWNISIAAGQTYQIPQNGTQFEILAQTGACAIRTSNSKRSGQFNSYAPGLGQAGLDFTMLEVKNLTAASIVVSLVVGDSNFINHQLVLANLTTPNITYPTQPAVNATHINIPDISGGSFLDLSGVKWLPISRQAIIISNNGATPLLLQKLGATGPNSNAVLICPAGLPISHASGGDFSLDIGGGAINAIVSEIYQCLKATT